MLQRRGRGRAKRAPHADLQRELELTLRDELQRAPWGGPPCLYAIWARDGRFSLQPEPGLPLTAWPPEQAIRGLADAARAANGGYRAPEAFYGLAFFAEHPGPAVREPGHPPVARSTARSGRAVDLTGTSYLAIQRRGSIFVPTYFDRPGDGLTSGPVAAALAEAVTALTRGAGQDPGPGQREL